MELILCTLFLMCGGESAPEPDKGKYLITVSGTTCTGSAEANFELRDVRISCRRQGHLSARNHTICSKQQDDSFRFSAGRHGRCDTIVDGNWYAFDLNRKTSEGKVIGPQGEQALTCVPFSHQRRTNDIDHCEDMVELNDLEQIVLTTKK